MDYSKHTTNRVETPQNLKVPGVKKQARNNAGGISFKISKWDYLMRFLILGTEGGTFYVSERKLTRDAAANVEKCIKEDGKRVVDTVVMVSDAGRAAKNDAAIFALALCASCDDKSVRKYAFANLNKVCRIGTHLFQFVHFAKTMRGFGRTLRDAIANWYISKDAEALAFQLFKYQQRDGWSHRDVLRLSHPKPLNDSQDELFSYVCGKRSEIPEVSEMCVGMRKLKGEAKTADKVAKLIVEYRLPREVVPTDYLCSVKVWEALLESMPITACIRNLGKMGSIGMLDPGSASVAKVVDIITDDNRIKKGRVHPLNIMNAFATYNEGRGMKGSLSWKPNPRVRDALEDAFYASFNHIEPTGKRFMLALDVSGSMAFESSRISGSRLTAREASAVMAMVTMRTEKEHFITGFRHTLEPLNISPRDTLGHVVHFLGQQRFGATDCSKPMLYAISRNLLVDVFVVYTDSETWAGHMHPWQALEKYRNKSGIDAKLIVVGMTASRFSIANPSDPGMLDVVGFDTNTPNAISQFAAI